MASDQPLVSIIIPCYNHGGYVMEALESARQQSYPHYEVIVVDDGSTDPATLATLASIKGEVRVIHQANAGPSVARHNAIQQSSGKYLFFLDSDNKVRPEYISRGVQVMEQQPRVGVVHGDALMFGASSEVSRSAPFDIGKNIFTNTIDLCCVMRRQAYDEAGGFDTYLSRLGLEDWELWFRVYERGWQFHYVPEVLYEYRVLEASRTQQVANKNLDKIIPYIYQKHAGLIYSRYRDLYYENRQLKASLDKKIGAAVLIPYRMLKRLFK